MERRNLIRGAGAAAVAGALPAAPALAQGAAARTLRVVPQANLTSLDPIWTSAVVTRNHAFMIYDQLCAQDAAGLIRPQMAEGWLISEDRLTVTFTLRAETPAVAIRTAGQAAATLVELLTDTDTGAAVDVSGIALVVRAQ